MNRLLKSKIKEHSAIKLLLHDATTLAPGLLSEVLGNFVIAVFLGKYLEAEGMAIYTLLWLSQVYLGSISTYLFQSRPA